jgi:predicted membrane protein
MYASLWRVLPGPWWVRALILLIAAAAILAVCVFWVFPWIQPFVSPPPPETVSN